MSKKYILALDQGTTSSRALLFDRKAQVKGIAQQSFPQIYLQPGWVEQDPREILSSQLSTLTEVLVTNDIEPKDIEAIGITNQRETTVVWNRKTGIPVTNAIVWQCRRTASIVDEICSDPAIRAMIVKKTGLIPDAYFSASKIKWILDNIEGAREAAEAGELCFGTVDSWLIWSLTNGSVHATDYTNASRTMLFDIHNGTWSSQLCELFDIPISMLPEVRPSSSVFGVTSHPSVSGGIPIAGVAGDQQAALFGQCCFEPGQAKSTYGTGCFLLMHTGNEPCQSHNGLVSTIAASAPEANHIEYALEGSVFAAGSLIQWLCEELGLLSSPAEAERLAHSVGDTGGAYVVPAFTGLGAPYWDADARGAIYGLTRGTHKAHIARAALEALAYQVHDLVEAMEADAQKKMTLLNVDGGASVNDFLMQFQSDILDIDLMRPEQPESTAIGAAFLAGLRTGFWRDVDEVCSLRIADEVFTPCMNDQRKERLIAGWHEAVARTRSDIVVSARI